MPSHFVSLNQGEEGFILNDFTVGALSTAGDVFEFRVLDGVSPKPRRIEVIKALRAFVRYFENQQNLTGQGWDLFDA
jgi:hypothetical protein